MFVLDTPDAPPQHAPVMIAQAGQAQLNDAKPERRLGICHVIANPPLIPDSAANIISPAGEGRLYFWLYEGRKIVDEATSKVTILQNPQHGTLVDKGDRNFSFLPQAGYFGKDKATLLVEFGSLKVKVTYFFQMPDHNFGQNWIEEFCGKKGYSWKISLPILPTSTSDFQSLLTFTGISGSVTVETADLPGTAVAQTTGEYITFDSNAAGHGWFVDGTPDDNSEFLPTSNPNQWIAKEGTEAAGKMDLLSVLLHEYGHVLGIDHSADGNDFMAATLQPGVRRLPSSDELVLMAQLAGQARLALDGSDAPAAPNPALPLTALGFALFGRIRRTDYGAWTIQAESASLLPQYQIAINPTLSPLPTPLPLAGEGANVAASGGMDQSAWQTSGNIALASPSTALRASSVTLGESASAQAHLAQGFVINPGDRTLSFTVENDLQANGGSGTGPSDAFEVALLNANTGEALTGTDGLSQSDAGTNQRGQLLH